MMGKDQNNNDTTNIIKYKKNIRNLPYINHSEICIGFLFTFVRIQWMI